MAHEVKSSRSAVLVCLVLPLCAAVVTTLPPAQYNALESLYDATNGPYWVWKDPGNSWAFTNNASDPCFDAWEGIECNCTLAGDECDVVALNLHLHNLTGSLPADLGNLDRLLELDLSYNRVSGTLPSSVDNMAGLLYMGLRNMCLSGNFTSESFLYLRVLDLRNNMFDGFLPTLSSLLEFIDVGNNKAGSSYDFIDIAEDVNASFYFDNSCRDVQSTGFSGTIPSSLWNTKGLLSCYFNDNSLQDELTSTVAVDLPLLTTLDMSGNNLYGNIPTFLGQLTNLLYLDLSANKLRGVLPEELFYATAKLLMVNVSSNFLTGPMPQSIGQLSNLQVLEFQNNFMNFSLPPQLFELTSLQLLSAGRGNCISGPLPVAIGNLTNLEYLELSGAVLTGTIPDSILLLTKLKVLDLRYNKKKSLVVYDYENYYCDSFEPSAGFVGKIPNIWGNLLQLESLLLDKNRLSGSLFDVPFFSLQKLKVLSLRDNNFTGFLPIFHPDLDELHLDFNWFVGTLPASYGVMSSLKDLSVSNNYLHGSIPSAWGSLTNLQSLTLSTNKIGMSNEIPSFVWKLTKLTWLDIASNRFSGTISSKVGNLTHIKDFRISKNNISGEIPSNLYTDCVTLERLFVGDNMLSGQIPNSISSLSNLEQLSINSNSFDGEIPSVITSMTKLKEIRLGNNNFHGPLPDWDTEMPYLRLISADNNSLSGPIPASTGSMLPNLVTLYLGQNKLSSSIPSSLFTSNSIMSMDLSINSLVGSLPNVPSAGVKVFGLSFLNLGANKLAGEFPTSLIERNSRLTALVLYQNKFVGSVPDYTKLAGLSAFVVCRNSFDGSLPAIHNSDLNLSAAYPLRDFDVSENHLTGTVPSYLGTHKKMTNFLLYDNAFSGTIPSNLIYSELKDFRIDENKFSGTFPSIIVASTKVDNFMINANKFEGNLDNVFPEKASNNALGISNIDVSDNLFTGSIPRAIFEMKRLRTFAASKNCFSGRFPDNMCSPSLLEVLVMSSLSTSDICSSSFSGALKYFPEFEFRDELPYCLFNKTNIREIYMSGNGIYGHLPHIGNTTLDVLELNNNAFTGTIPACYFTNVRNELNLDGNRLGGELPNAEFPSTLAVHIRLNRLSGRIPSSFYDATDVDILAGNVFYCEAESELPRGDPYHEEYTCASNMLDYSLFFWFGVLIIALICIAVLSWIVRERSAGIRISSSEYCTEMSVRKEGDDVLPASSQPPFSMRSRVSYIIKSERWVAFENFCRWYRTGAYLSGDCASILQEQLQEITNETQSNSGTFTSNSKSLKSVIDPKISMAVVHQYKYSRPGRNSELSRFVTLLLLVRSIFILLAVVILVLLLPIYLGIKSNTDYSTHDIQYGWIITAAYMSGGVPAALASFSWISICLFFFWVVHISYVEFFSNSEVVAPTYIKDRQRRASSKRADSTPSLAITFVFGIAIDRTVERAMISIAALAFNIFIVLSSTYLYLIAILSDQPSETKIVLQWVFAMWKMMWNSFGVPTCFHAMRWIKHHHKVFFYITTLLFNNVISVVVTSALTDSSCFNEIWEGEDTESLSYKGKQCEDYSAVFEICYGYGEKTYEIEYATPPVYNFLCSSQIVRSFVPIFFYVYAGTAFSLPTIFYILACRKKTDWPSYLMRVAPPMLWPDELLHERQKHLMQPNIVMNVMVGHIMIILTFGLFNPLLAVCIAVTVAIITSMWVMLIGRYLEVAEKYSHVPEYEDERLHMDVTFADVWTTLYHSRWTIVISVCLCYFILIFDYVGDKSGATMGLGVALLVSSFFVVMYVISSCFEGTRISSMLYRYYFRHSTNSRLFVLKVLRFLKDLGTVESKEMLSHGLHSSSDDDIGEGVRLTEYVKECTTTSNDSSLAMISNPIFKDEPSCVLSGSEE